MRELYLCLDTVTAAPFEPKYADGYVVCCFKCGWHSNIHDIEADACYMRDALLRDSGSACEYSIVPTVGSMPAFPVQCPAEATVVWRADGPGMEPRKIAMSNVDFRKSYGKAE